MKDIITDSIRYWELRRIAFNVILGVLVVASYFYNRPPLEWQLMIGLLLSAVAANVFYCTAYLADIFFQMSEYRQMWRQYRWALFIAGIVFAAGAFLLTQ